MSPRSVIARIGKSPKAYTVCFIGAASADLPPNARFAATLKEAAEKALGGERRIGASFDPIAAASRLSRRRTTARRIEGLFAGGTLCAEAQVILAAGGRKVTSNAAVPGVPHLDAPEAAGRDRIIDLGADEYTLGRPHPMIDPSVRDEALRAALRNPEVAVVLLDLVIGYGAHASPAAPSRQHRGRSRGRRAGPCRLGDRHRTRPPGSLGADQRCWSRLGSWWRLRTRRPVNLHWHCPTNDVRVPRYANN